MKVTIRNAERTLRGKIDFRLVKEYNCEVQRSILELPSAQPLELEFYLPNVMNVFSVNVKRKWNSQITDNVNSQLRSVKTLLSTKVNIP